MYWVAIEPAVLAAVKDLSVTAEATSNLSAEQPFIGITVDRTKAAEHGLSEIQVGGIVTAAMNPSAVGSVSSCSLGARLPSHTS